MTTTTSDIGKNTIDIMETSNHKVLVQVEVVLEYMTEFDKAYWICSAPIFKGTIVFEDSKQKAIEEIIISIQIKMAHDMHLSPSQIQVDPIITEK